MPALQVAVRRLSGPQNRFLRFLVIGGINTVFGYGCYAFFLWLGLNAGAALAVSTVAGIFFNFRTTGKLVFQNTRYGLIWKFIAVYGLVYAVNYATIYLLGRAGLDAYLAQLLFLPAGVVLSYTLNKVVFGVGTDE